jgi:hypothetical protein
MAPYRNPAVQEAVKTTYRSASITSALLLNPISSMTTTSMVSIQSLRQCLFSDVDPLDPSMNPFGANIAPEIGGEYRGTVVAALATYAVMPLGMAAAAWLLVHLDVLPDAFEFLRVPSIAMVPISFMHQGMVTAGVALLRLQQVPVWDSFLGTLSLVSAVGVTVAVFIATRPGSGVAVHIEKEAEDEENGQQICRDNFSRKDPPLAWEFRTPVVSSFLRFTQWDSHWVEIRPKTDGAETSNPVASAVGSRWTALLKGPGCKRRFLVLFDDLRVPWWTALELSSGIVQGAIIGIRISDAATCRVQLVLLEAHCAAILALSGYVMPFGSACANMFLLLSKVAALAVATIELIGNEAASDREEALRAAADNTTAVSTFLLLLQTGIQVLLAVVMAVRFIAHRLPRLTGRRKPQGEDSDPKTAEMSVSSPTAAAVVSADDSQQQIVQGDEGLLVVPALSTSFSSPVPFFATQPAAKTISLGETTKVHVRDEKTAEEDDLHRAMKQLKNKNDFNDNDDQLYTATLLVSAKLPPQRSAMLQQDDESHDDRPLGTCDPAAVPAKTSEFRGGDAAFETSGGSSLVSPSLLFRPREIADWQLDLDDPFLPKSVIENSFQVPPCQTIGASLVTSPATAKNGVESDDSDDIL